MMDDQRRRFRDAVDHVPTKRFLAYAYFSPSLDADLRRELGVDAEADLTEVLGMFRPGGVQVRHVDGFTPPDYGGYYTPEDRTPGSFLNGIGVLEVPGSSYHFTKYISPLRHAETLREIEAFPFLDPSTLDFSGLKAQVDAFHAEGRAAVMWVGHLYETSWQIRGYERFLEDMLLEPAHCECILDHGKEWALAFARAGAEAGCDYLMTGDDVANQRTLMFSIDLWRRFLKPRWTEIYDAARSVRPDIPIWYHSDGNILDILPELVDMGVSLLNPVQPECMDPVEVKRVLGRRCAIDGSVGTQTTMPFGSAADVKDMVRRRIDTLGRDGGLILSPTHMLEPEVPVENVLAFFDAVREAEVD